MKKVPSRRGSLSKSKVYALVAACAAALAISDAGALPDGTVVDGNLDVGATATPGKLKVVGQTGASAIPSLEVTGDGGVFFKGAYGVGVIPTTGTGSLLMWYPKKMAFRAGYVSGSHWQDSNIGDGSVVLGYNSKASGESSFAFGANNEATGQNSITFGSSNDATGAGTISIGEGNYASALNSAALGFGSSTYGQYSIAAGYYTTAQAKNQFVVGSKNIAQGNSTSWVASDDLFIVGNGVSAYSNAFTVKKNGITSLFGTEGATTATIVLDPTGSTPGITVGGKSVLTASSTANFAFAGNLGVGNSGVTNAYPDADNVVVGSTTGSNGLTVIGATNGRSNIFFGDADHSHIGILSFNHSNNKLQIGGTGYEGANGMYLDSAGRVGIGTNSPTGKLEIVSGEYVGALRVLSGTSNATTSIWLGRSSRDGEWAVAAANNWYANGSVPGDSVFKTVGKKLIFDTNDGTGTPALTIASQNGNVGIGTTAPAAKLEVNGTVKFTKQGDIPMGQFGNSGD